MCHRIVADAVCLMTFRVVWQAEVVSSRARSSCGTEDVANDGAVVDDDNDVDGSALVIDESDSQRDELCDDVEMDQPAAAAAAASKDADVSVDGAQKSQLLIVVRRHLSPAPGLV